MLHLYEFCRLCAQKKRNKFDLFTNQNSEEARMLLAKISICLSLHVTREDILPKMICHDCQRSIEQFNLFRMKCHKAEERLLKMLSASMPNKATVTRIKEEYLETDFQENGTYFGIDSEQFDEPSSYHNLKAMNNVKCEVNEETDLEDNSNANVIASDLIQIISDEVVNQHFEDVKQPQIEIISEDFRGKMKNVDVVEIGTYEQFDEKMIPETVLKISEDMSIHQYGINSLVPETEPIHFIEIKQPVGDSEEEVVNCMLPNSQRSQIVNHSESEIPVKKQKRKKSKRKMLYSSDCEEDVKYLTLAEGEVCTIDMEEMEAVIKKKENPNMKFNCDTCKKSFKFFKSLRKHKLWHKSQPEIFVCDICRKNNIKTFEFSSLKSLNNHRNRKHMPHAKCKFECQICNKKMLSKGELNAHHQKVHDNVEVTCGTCNKKFKNKIRLNSHLIVHREERPYVCDQCGQSFKWSNVLKVHMQWHRQEKNFLCSECGKKFTAKKNLLEHLNIHTGKRPFTCEHCNATFVQLSAYSKHLYLHNEGTKIHKCDKCHKSYSHAHMLRQHLLRHTGLRPFECPKCQCSFKSQSDLWCHSKTHQDKQYGCHVCGRKFSLSKTLRDHMVLHTGIKHFCPAPGCGKTYTQRFSLTKHFTKQHPTLTIVNRKGGRKAHLEDKTVVEENSSDFIRYDYKEKEFAV
ncbi:hypothetical protein RUM43_002268 [Polyplax serrata]|uniref:Uncharacterized protein n=1 Tax=Polyplax serrata TaxID=468196 RepID=A0AAN8PCE5_POLSC